jgi:hypothetical protein
MTAISKLPQDTGHRLRSRMTFVITREPVSWHAARSFATRSGTPDQLRTTSTSVGSVDAVRIDR